MNSWIAQIKVSKLKLKMWKILKKNIKKNLRKKFPQKQKQLEHQWNNKQLKKWMKLNRM